MKTYELGGSCGADPWRECVERERGADGDRRGREQERGKREVWGDVGSCLCLQKRPKASMTRLCPLSMQKASPFVVTANIQQIAARFLCGIEGQGVGLMPLHCSFGFHMFFSRCLCVFSGFWEVIGDKLSAEMGLCINLL
jgi:hypothetical protein